MVIRVQKCDRLDAATSLGDIASFPGHRLEKLKGDWSDESPGPARVTIDDYH